MCSCHREKNEPVYLALVFRRQHDIRIESGLQPGGRPLQMLLDKEGKARVLIEATDDGTARQVFYDGEGTRRDG